MESRSNNTGETFAEAARRLLARLERAVEMKKASGRLQGPDEFHADGVCHGIERDRPENLPQGKSNRPERPSASDADSFGGPFTVLGSNARRVDETSQEFPRSLAAGTVGGAALAVPELFEACNDNVPALKGGAR